MLTRKLAHLSGALVRQWMPYEVLRQYQLRSLRRVLAHAEAHAPVYQQKWRAAGVRACDLAVPEDLALFPTITKDEVRAAYPERILTRPLRSDDVVFHTSGSSGHFLHVAYDASTNDLLDAVYARALFAAGYRPWDRIAYFWWADRDDRTLYERAGLMKKHYLRSDGDPERQLEELRRLRPDVIYHFPTSLVAIAKLIERRPALELAPRLVICHGELASSESKRYLTDVFRCPVFDQYGAQEFNRMAWECDRHDGMHLDADSIYVEVLREDGRPAAPGEEGEVVVTGLHGTLMPLIRYRIGDLGRHDPRACDCGRGLPLFQLTGGRIDDHLLSPSGRSVGPRRIVPRVEQHEGIRQFRVIQRARDEVEILLVKEAGAPATLEAEVERELRAILDEPAVRIRCHSVDAIPLSGRGKLRCVERSASVR